MSGAGRKHRAKHLTQQYLDVSGWMGPKEGETLAVCLESPHGQHARVLLLSARPQDAPILNKESAEATENGAASSSAEATSLASPQPREDGGEAVALEEQLAFLPGKFHKVIWLRIKDIVVVSDGTVTFKPSPEQVQNFLKDPAHTGWRERIAAAQLKAEEQRVAVQRMPQYSAATKTTTSVLSGPQVHRGARQTTGGERQEGSDAEEKEEEEDGEEGEDLVNPNWRSIKHHQQFFYGLDDDSSEEEEEVEGKAK